MHSMYLLAYRVGEQDPVHLWSDHNGWMFYTRSEFPLKASYIHTCSLYVVLSLNIITCNPPSQSLRKPFCYWNHLQSTEVITVWCKHERQAGLSCAALHELSWFFSSICGERNSRRRLLMRRRIDSERASKCAAGFYLQAGLGFFLCASQHKQRGWFSRQEGTFILGRERLILLDSLLSEDGMQRWVGSMWPHPVEKSYI